MKSGFITALLLLVCLVNLSAQVTEAEDKLRAQKADTIQGWKKGGVLTLSLAQTSLTNWASGGQNSMAVNGMLSLFSNYHMDKTVWDNSLDMGYGILKQGRESDYMKTDDKFDFLSKFGKQAFDHIYYAALFNFKTQMAEGLDYAGDTSKISNFLAPAYIIGAIGLDYKPNTHFSAFIAPLTGKITIVNDEDLSASGSFGVEPGEKSKTELGSYIRLIYTKNDFTAELLKNVTFTTKLDLFSNYLDNPQNIDVNWETLLALKVNKFISVNVNTHLIYDDDIIKRTQFKEILGVGFSMKF